MTLQAAHMISTSLAAVLSLAVAVYALYAQKHQTKASALKELLEKRIEFLEKDVAFARESERECQHERREMMKRIRELRQENNKLLRDLLRDQVAKARRRARASEPLPAEDEEGPPPYPTRVRSCTETKP